MVVSLWNKGNNNFSKVEKKAVLVNLFINLASTARQVSC